MSTPQHDAHQGQGATANRTYDDEISQLTGHDLIDTAHFLARIRTEDAEAAQTLNRVAVDLHWLGLKTQSKHLLLGIQTQPPGFAARCLSIRARTGVKIVERLEQLEQNAQTQDQPNKTPNTPGDNQP